MWNEMKFRRGHLIQTLSIDILPVLSSIILFKAIKPVLLFIDWLILSHIQDYSTQWAEYYRSLGMIKEAELIESQVTALCPEQQFISNVILSLVNTVHHFLLIVFVYTQI